MGPGRGREAFVRGAVPGCAAGCTAWLPATWPRLLRGFQCLWTCPLTLPSASLPPPQVVAWYDNEWGYSQRVVDLAEITASKWE